MNNKNNKKVEYNFYRLNVWKLGMNLVNEIYSVTKIFPNEEKFGLTSQIRRAAVSVPLNIAEGSTRRTKKDFAQFVRIALGSLMEVMACIEIALNQKYVNQKEYEKIQGLIQELYFKLIALDKFLISKNN
ncbi:MAG: four helix bundle protein [Patescibacteria group bacterium]